jgi:hypothetical protein
MRHSFCIVVALLLSAIPAQAGVRRTEHPVRPSEADVSGFDPAQSAALFVGVRDYTYDETLTEVRYAVDDAIDLAFVMAFDRKSRLVMPERVILALSGDPQKPESQRKLYALIAAGATVRPAGQADVLTLLERQSRAAGRKGVLIVLFAAHGINDEGTQYLLTASSLLRHRETAVSENELRDIASQSEAARSLILVDACRQKLTSDSRDGEPDPRSAAPLIRGMSGVTGQVVFSAAAAGEYAYDDDTRRNGVFTAAVIDGLRCGATTDERGLVTVDTLATFVEERVLTWVQKNRDPGARRATQLISEGRAKTMPLADCGARTRRPATLNWHGEQEAGLGLEKEGARRKAEPLRDQWSWVPLPRTGSRK